MLARLAENLYWMGRYIERTEYVARYLKVQYFSAQDAPIKYGNDFNLSAIIKITGSKLEVNEDTNEKDVLYDVVFNKANEESLINIVHNIRRNANSIRPIISNELWESINTFFHMVNTYDVEHFKSQGLFDFTNAVIKNCAVFRAFMESTMLHDDVWSFIKLGIHIEGVFQTARVISSKLSDIDGIKKEGVIEPAEESYQWLTTLKILSGLNMSSRIYKNVPERVSTLEFLVTNTQFPQSIAYNLKSAEEVIKSLTRTKNRNVEKHTLEYLIAQLFAKYRFVEIGKTKNINAMLNGIISQIALIHERINSKFFEN